jgi:hypothetical protein
MSVASVAVLVLRCSNPLPSALKCYAAGKDFWIEMKIGSGTCQSALAATGLWSISGFTGGV